VVQDRKRSVEKKETQRCYCKKDAYNAKLAPKYTGPLEVRKIISPVIVDLRDARGKWHRHIHVQDLKPANDGINKNFHAETKQGDPDEVDVKDLIKPTSEKVDDTFEEGET